MNDENGPVLPEDPLSTARGIVNGLIFGCALWLVIIVIALAFVLIFLKGAMS